MKEHKNSLLKRLFQWWHTKVIAYGNGDYDNRHMCRASSSSVACFETRSGELWVKEYSTQHEPEGRTYEVSFCPFCGYQTAKSSVRQVTIHSPENGVLISRTHLYDVNFHD